MSASEEEKRFCPEILEILKFTNSDHFEDISTLDTAVNWCTKNSFAIPDMDVLKEIANHTGNKLLVDIYAGSGYWGAILKKMNLRVLAFDLRPHAVCHMPVSGIRSDELLRSMNLDECVLFYGFPNFVTPEEEISKGGYFPELSIWKGRKIISIVDHTDSPFKRDGKYLPVTGDVLKAANELTGFKWEMVCSIKLKYKFYKVEEPRMEVYIRH